jgi:hypothetical protein
MHRFLSMCTGLQSWLAKWPEFSGFSVAHATICPKMQATPRRWSPPCPASAQVRVNHFLFPGAAFRGVRLGEMAEWFKAPVLKTGVGATPPWVRIPLSPPDLAALWLLPPPGGPAHATPPKPGDGAQKMDGAVGTGPYPGTLATSSDILRLAKEYHRSAVVVASLGRRGDPISRAPYRLTAIHAVELYLNAYLLKAGHEPSYIRGLQHDMAARTDLCVASGLVLRKRTAAHLRAMTVSREYVVTRYGPELTSTLPQINRLAATLEEVAIKVDAAVGCLMRPKAASP